MNVSKEIEKKVIYIIAEATAQKEGEVKLNTIVDANSISALKSVFGNNFLPEGLLESAKTTVGDVITYLTGKA